MDTTQDIIVEKGKQIYYQIKPDLEKKYTSGDFVSIEVTTGSYFVGKTPVDAIQLAQKKFPGKQFFISQVGRMSGMLK